MTRSLRILLVANDGFSAGHVARTVAIARALARRDVTLRTLVLTTSEADVLLAGLAVVRLPAPATARRAGFADAERRRLAAAVVDGVMEGFAPDLVVADTFPGGPHGELAHVGRRAKRALIRRATIDGDATASGLVDYDLAIVADDPVALDLQLPVPVVRVPPITLGEPMLPRDEARRALGLRGDRVVLVAAGGGGDADAAARAEATAASIARVAPDVQVALAVGPLDRRGEPAASSPVVRVRVAPLQRYLLAFDGAVSPAGYNTAHELASARVPAALFAQPRPFDDQAARAARFAAAGLAIALDALDDASIAAALAWMATAERPRFVADGAGRAAEALIALATGSGR